MGTFKDIYDVGMDWTEARMPLKIGLSVRDDPQTIYVSVTNRTRKSPVFVHAVRIHHCRNDYSYSFTLEPYGKQQIEPKDTKDFLLSPARPIHVAHHPCVKKLPAPDDAAAPPFDSPADLFRAIANGQAKHSWVEVDFNEFKERKFKKGELKNLFSAILQRAIAKRPQEQKRETPHVTALSKSSAPLKIKARMEMRHNDKKEILLAVDVVNMGEKIAFIKKVAVVLPRLTVTAVKNPAIRLSPDTSELVAHQTPRLIEIKPDGGLFTWEMILRDNLQYGIEEIDEVKHGRGYVELTSGEKIDFRYLPLPDSAWEALAAPIAPVFEGKTGYKCSQCRFVLLMPTDAATAICPNCQHIGDLKPNPTAATQVRQEKIAAAAKAVHTVYLQIVNSYEDCTVLVEENGAEKLRARQTQFQIFEQSFGVTFQANSVYLPSDAVNDIRTIVNDCIRYVRMSARVQRLIDSKPTEKGQKVVETQHLEIEKLENKILSLRPKVESHFQRLIAG